MKTVPATVTKLDLPFGGLITAATIDQSGRMWFGYISGEPEPGIGSMDSQGRVTLERLPAETHGHVIGGLAVTSKREILATILCYPYGSDCGKEGYVRLTPDGVPLDDIQPLGSGEPEPIGISLAADDSAWISEKRANAVAHLDPTGRVSTFSLHDSQFYPVGMDVIDGKAFADGPGPAKIAEVDETGRVRWLMTPSRSSQVSSARPGIGGRIWIAEYDANKIVSVDGRGREIEYTLPTSDSKPVDVAVDRRGVVWFIEGDTDKVGYLDPDGTIRDAFLPNALGTPIYLFAGPRDTLYVLGTNKQWFGLFQSFSVARIPESTTIP